MAHRVARERGWANVDKMLRSLTARQWVEIEAAELLERFDPTGETQRMDYRIATIVHMLYATNATKNTPQKTLKDFLLKFEEKKPEAPVDKVGWVLEMMARARAVPGTDE